MHGHDIFYIEHSLVTLIYLLIASQFYIKKVQTNRNIKAKRALTYLVFIFTFCAFCGYIAQIFNLPSAVERVSLWGLILSGFLFFITNQASVILLGFEKDD